MENLDIKSFKTYFSDNSYKELPCPKRKLAKDLLIKELKYQKELNDKSVRMEVTRMMIQDMSSNGKVINESLEVKASIKTKKYGVIDMSSYITTVEELENFVRYVTENVVDN